MSKYYTPTIDEFHEGFECEISRNHPWQQHIFTLDNWIIEGWLYEYIPNGIIFPNRIRVKCLDAEDIESLGWKPDTENLPEGCFEIQGFEMVHDPINSKIWTSITGEDLDYNQSPTQVFDGTIRNKSELKTLMRQLGIAIPQ